jgi:Tfp pilus assembly protein FimT
MAEVGLAMNKSENDSEQGASVVELLIVLVVSGILMTAAVTMLGGAKSNLVRQNIAREFKVSLERARFDSVKRHAIDDSTMAQVKIIGGTSFNLTTDFNQNGVIDLGDTRLIDFSAQSGITLLLPSGIIAPVTIQFDQLGHSIVSDYNGIATDHFYFCDSGVTPANATSSNSSVVYLSSTGTVAMLGGGDAPPSASVPTVSNVSSDSGINPDLTLYTGVLPTPTPSPTPTPTGTPPPTPTPNPTPTPSGTPGPTPTPTPPLPSCTLNQKPGSPATCQCNSPWFIGRNGKCGP